MSASSDNVNLVASIRLRPDCVEAAHALIAAYTSAVLREPGNLRFETFTDLEEPLVVVILERYADRAAFRAHMEAPENEAFNRELEAVTAGGSTLQFLGPL